MEGVDPSMIHRMRCPPFYKGCIQSMKGAHCSMFHRMGSTPIYSSCGESLEGVIPSMIHRMRCPPFYKGCNQSMEGAHHSIVPFVNRPFEWDIHGTVNFTTFCFVLRVTWCHRVPFSCYLRPKRGPTNVCKLQVLSSHMVSHIR